MREEGRGQHTESSEDALVVIDVTHPKGILCENVKQMTKIVEAESDDAIDFNDALMKDVDSDAKYVLKCLSDRGLFAKDFIMEARDHGSMAKRVRCLALVWREDAPEYWQHSLTSTCKSFSHVCVLHKEASRTA